MGLLPLILTVFVLLSSTSSQECNFGPSCWFDCYCESGGSCDYVTGVCDTGDCRAGSPPGYQWAGYGCLTGNVAYDKTAKQNGQHADLAASGAVDGSVHPFTGCSHPLAPASGSPGCPTNDDCSNAWWQVDLGRQHRITHVITVNTNRSDIESNRMNHIAIRVSDSEDVNTGSYCASITSTMTPGETRTYNCTSPAIGRYVTLYKYSATNANNDHIGVFTVCEVVVIGNIYNDCTDCSVTNVCTNTYGCVTGCMAGVDPETLCAEDCLNGYYGENCRTPCGRCSPGDVCDKGDGRCPGGCQAWWVGYTCSSEIAQVDFPSGAVLSVTDTGRDHLTISWSAITSIPQYKATYYGYRVQYRIQSASSWTLVTDVPHPTDRPVITRDIRSLRYNTDYDLRVTVYRTQGGSKGFGNYISATGKTSCIDPQRPTISSLTAAGPSGGRGLERILISWQLPSGADIGCSYLARCTISYRRRPGDTWRDTDCGLSSTSKTLTVTEEGEHEVYIRIYNNGNLWSDSDTGRVTVDNIVPAEFPSTDAISVTDTNSDTLVVSFRAITSIAYSDRNKYGYRVEYKRTSPRPQSTWTLVKDLAHVPGRTYVETVSGLTYNTEYQIRVSPYRVYGGINIYGTAISVNRKTACVAPDDAEILELSNVDPKNETGLERIFIRWRLPSMTGCSRLSSCTVHVTAGSTEYQEDCTASSGEGSATLSLPDPGTYTVYIRMVNNEHLSSRSQPRYIAINNITAGGFNPGDRLIVDESTSDMIRVTWQAVSDIPSENEAYGYIVRYQAIQAQPQLSHITGSWMVLSNLSHIPDHTYKADVTGLSYNTVYSIRVTPYTVYRGRSINGWSIGTQHKTKCIEPGRPEITNITVVPPLKETGWQRIYLSLVVPNHTGCSTLAGCTIHYRVGVTDYSQTCLPTAGPQEIFLSVEQEGDVNVYLEISNNEDISSTTDSESVSVEQIVPAGPAACGGRDPWLPVSVAVPVAVVVLALTIVAHVVIARKYSSHNAPVPAEYVNIGVMNRPLGGIAEITVDKTPRALNDVGSQSNPPDNNRSQYININISNPAFDSDAVQQSGANSLIEPGQTDDNPYEDIQNQTRDFVPNVYDVIATTGPQ